MGTQWSRVPAFVCLLMMSIRTHGRDGGVALTTFMAFSGRLVVCCAPGALTLWFASTRKWACSAVVNDPFNSDVHYVVVVTACRLLAVCILHAYCHGTVVHTL
jgi:hypothetical protein